MKTVLVTVGTTGFDDLIEVVSSKAFATTILSLGFSKVIVQYGSSIQKFCEDSFRQLGITVVSFDYCPSLEPYLNTVELVVGHAGAGTILDTLRHHRPLVVVVNERLMGNHQHEIADAMASENYLLRSTPSTVIQVLKHLQDAHLAEYPEAHPELFAAYLNGRCGFAE